MRVIARAYGDEPLVRYVCGKANGLIYLSRKSGLCAKNDERIPGVGFPKTAVFCHESDLYDSLRAAWAADDSRALNDLWQKASPVGDRFCD